MSGSVSVRQQQSRAPSHEGSTASTGGAAPSTTGTRDPNRLEYKFRQILQFLIFVFFCRRNFKHFVN